MNTTILNWNSAYIFCFTHWVYTIFIYIDSNQKTWQNTHTAHLLNCLSYEPFFLFLKNYIDSQFKFKHGQEFDSTGLVLIFTMLTSILEVKKPYLFSLGWQDHLCRWERLMSPANKNNFYQHKAQFCQNVWMNSELEPQ